MAQELHDVLAHNISLINVQAGVALHLIDERPEQARIALAAIKDASKDALGELRSVLGVLRAPDDEAPRAPAPSLSQLDGLLVHAEAVTAPRERMELRRAISRGPVGVQSLDDVHEDVVLRDGSEQWRRVGGHLRTSRLAAVDGRDPREGFGPRIELVEASAEALPFPDGSFDHLTVTYLLRYVEDPGATLRELTRVVRSGGVVASLEFGVPTGLARPAWELYVRAGLPIAGRALRHGWSQVGDFLGGSIRSFWDAYPLERQLELWADAGVTDVDAHRLSLGGGVVLWGRKA